MIISKPQPSTLISFALFLAITTWVTVLNVRIILKISQVPWYNYALVAVLVPIGLFVFYKIFIRYKILKMGDNQIQIDYPVLRKSNKYPLAQIIKWTENIVKTGKNSVYKELRILFADGQSLSVGHREHTEYLRMVQYLSQKIPKKKSA
ncbi:MAG: hypothetical protein JST48_10795 [Bacteroidetes bacterium]|nr:hypothetical protein [Bacteroidota bacterium]